ncbi:MAG: hypothetical protein ACI9Y1_000705 [Lentisphaeria bacterium]|jgi:hypothetical protein
MAMPPWKPTSAVQKILKQKTQLTDSEMRNFAYFSDNTKARWAKRYELI